MRTLVSPHAHSHPPSTRATRLLLGAAVVAAGFSAVAPASTSAAVPPSSHVAGPAIPWSGPVPGGRLLGVAAALDLVPSAGPPPAPRPPRGAPTPGLVAAPAAPVAVLVPVPLPAPAAPPVFAPPPPSGATPTDVWARLRTCESNGNYADDTGNGYYGAYQFSLPTWQSLGLSGLPSQAPPAVQDDAARRLQARSGWGQWPACARRLGLV